MKVFADTSGIYAALVATDDAHTRAKAALERLVRSRARLVTTSYVLVETHALLQARIGLEAVRLLQDVWLPELEVVWVAEELHHRGVRRLLREDRRKLSLVDCVSFECMDDVGATTAFAADEHFRQAGFRLALASKA